MSLTDYLDTAGNIAGTVLTALHPKQTVVQGTPAAAAKPFNWTPIYIIGAIASAIALLLIFRRK